MDDLEVFSGLRTLLELDSRERETFVSAVRHELKSPAGRVEMFTDFIRRTCGSSASYDMVVRHLEGIRDSVSAILNFVERLDQVDEDTLDDFERIARTPLVFLREHGIDDLAEQVSEHDDIRTYLRFISGNLADLDSIVREFFGDEDVRYSVPLALNLYRAQLEPMTKPKRIQLVTDLGHSDVVLNTSYRGVFTNLLRNAIVHGHRGVVKPNKHVIVRGRPVNDGSYFFAVSDNGRGINLDEVYAAAIRAGVVDFGAELDEETRRGLVFYSGVTTVDKDGAFSEGDGVGLKFVADKVSENGGKVGVVSRVDEGTTFYFTVPEERILELRD